MNAEKYLVLATSYVKMARTQRAIGRVYPAQKATSLQLAKAYMRLARSAYNTFLISAIYGE